MRVWSCVWSLTGLLFLLAPSAHCGTEARDFYGSGILRSYCSNACFVLSGEVTGRSIGVVHGGFVRHNVPFAVLKCYKGFITNTAVNVSIVSPLGGKNARAYSRGESLVLFVNAKLETIDPWFSVQTLDVDLDWSLDQLYADPARAGGDRQRQRKSL